jgi:uncharacterized protein YlxW (UPF0749 family)
MSRFNKIVYSLLIGLVIICAGMMSGCTKKPGGGSGTDASRLQEARSAVDDAERKLGELRQERRRLEKELQDKQSEGKKSK